MIPEYIRCSSIKEGDKLARTLYMDDDRILMRAGNKLTKASINAIMNQGYKGIYIESELSNKREDMPIAEPLIGDFESMQVVSLMKKMTFNTNILKDRNCPKFFTYRKDLEDYVKGFIDIFYDLNDKGELLLETEDARTRNTWIFYHSLNTCLIAIGMCAKMDLPKQRTFDIAMGAIFHDVGKLFINRELVFKDNINEKEKAEIREHCTTGFRMFQTHGYPVDTTYAIWQHHEREDGTGYPNRVDPSKIPLSAKIVGLASSYDNMVNYTPYNTNPIPQKDVLEMICADSRFNKECVIALAQFVTPYPIGTKVKLSNGVEGIVIKNKAGQPLRPLVLSGRADVYNLADDTRYLNVTIELTVIKLSY